AILVQHALSGIFSHDDSARFVDDGSADGNPAALALRIPQAGRGSAHRLDNVHKGLVHMLGLLDLMLGPAPVEAEHRDAPLVYGARIYVAVGVLVGNHLAAPGQSDTGPIPLADMLLQRLPIALMRPAGAVERSDLRHAESAADLDVIASREIFLLLIEQPPGHVDMHAADAVRIMPRQAFQRRNVAAEAVADRIGEVASDLSGGIRYSRRKSR